MAKAQRLSFEQIEILLKSAYNLSGDLKRLPGENENFQVITQEGDRYVLKLADADLSSATLELEHQILKHLNY